MLASQRVSTDNHPPKPVWVALCVILGAGLGLWSLYLVGVVVLAGASVTVALNQASRRGARATLLALTVGYEAALATLTALYVLAWGEPGAGYLYLYLAALMAGGLLIELPILWWRERHGDISPGDQRARRSDAGTTSRPWRIALWFSLCVMSGALIGLAITVLWLFLLPALAVVAVLARRRRFARMTLLALFYGYEAGATALTVVGLIITSPDEWPTGGWLLTRLMVALFGALALLLGLRYCTRE